MTTISETSLRPSVARPVAETSTRKCEPPGTAGLVARAEAIAPTLVERQAKTEARGYYAADMHEAFTAAGFYRALVVSAPAAGRSATRTGRDG